MGSGSKACGKCIQHHSDEKLLSNCGFTEDEIEKVMKYLKDFDFTQNSLYQNIFRYMFDAIEGRSELKMIMIGGHDITVDKFMNFLNSEDSRKILNNDFVLKLNSYLYYYC